MACNYDDTATIDDGSCQDPLDIYGNPNVDCDGNCLNDSDGDGICNEDEIPGCFDVNACHYDSSATDFDVTLCDYSCYGCTDEVACNYDDTATIDDGSCLDPVDLYDIPNVDCDGCCFNDADNDGICDENEVWGCVSLWACNYDSLVTEPDISLCDFSCYGCMDESACNYDSSATAQATPSGCIYPEPLYLNCEGECIQDSDGDGVCDGWCDDPVACNFTAMGECAYPELPCEFCEDGHVSSDGSLISCEVLEVDVVMDTVLYDGFVGSGDVVPAGFRRYNLYAVIPEDALMLGPAADNGSDPIMPPFGYEAGCGCYNWTSLFVPNGYNNAAAINGGFLGIAPELAYDSWWTSHVPVQVPGTSVFEAPGSFATDFDMCSDEVVQGALVVTSADPIHDQVENNRALIGQITTCESFNFRVCVAFQIGADVFTQCTDGFVEVTDLCAPLSDVTLSVGACSTLVEAPGLAPSVQFRLFDADTSEVLLETFDPEAFDIPYQGDFIVELFDTATTTAWSSNTCRRTFPITVEPGIFPQLGCTFQGADNYDPTATQDDGSCEISGCMEPEALNYLPFANVSAQCIFNAPGCLWDADLGDWDCSEFCASDINQDGIVSVPDLLILLGEFAGGCD